MSASVGSGGNSGDGIFVDPGNSGLISLTSDTVTGGRWGVSIATMSSGNVEISSMIFSGSLTPGATAIHFAGGVFVSSFSYVDFNDVNIAVNVNAKPLGLTSRITMNAHSGVRTNPAYENDPAGLVDWDDFPKFAGCAVTKNVGAGQNFATIQSAVSALPTTLTGRSCVVIRDGATYPEQVTVRNFTNNGSSITIFADPASGLTPVVSPPASSTAAFLIANASVNVQGISVAVNQSVPYGVWASSAYVQLSSVSVSVAGLGIYTAGVRISSWSAVSYSSVTVGDAYGFWLDGSTRTTVNFSTSVNNAAARPSIYLEGGKNNDFTVIFASNSAAASNAFFAAKSDSNTVTQSFLSGGIFGVQLSQGSDYNVISLSTMIGNTGDGLFAGTSDSNTVTQSYMWGGNRGAYFNLCSYSAISLSTMIGNTNYGLSVVPIRTP